MTVYIIGLAVFLAAAAIFLEFTFWIEKGMEPRNAKKLQAQQDAFNDLYLARRSYNQDAD